MKRAVIIALLACCLGFSFRQMRQVVAPSVVGPTILSRWQCDENAGATLVDAVGGKNGSISGTVSWLSHNAAYALDCSSGGSVDVTGTSAYANDLTDFSVSCWVNGPSSLANAVIVGKVGTGGIATGAGWYMWADAAAVKCVLQQSGGSVQQQYYSVAALDNSWHMVTFTVTSRAMTMYVDGSTALCNNFSTGTPSSYSNSNDIMIGTDSGGEQYAAKLDDVLIYSVALTSGQVATLYSAGAQARLDRMLCPFLFASN